MPTELIHRESLATLQQCLARQPSVLIRGSRGVGKSTLASQVANSTFDLSDPLDRAVLEDGAKPLLAKAPKPVLIDEWQLMPNIAWSVKHLIDRQGLRGFILAGSVPPRTGTFRQFPLANRCAVMELVPLSVSERRGRDSTALLDRLFAGDPPTDVEQLSFDSYRELLFRSGYPGMVKMDLAEQRLRLDDLTLTVIESDISESVPELSRRMSKENVANFLRVCAEHSGTMTTTKTLGDLSHIGERTARRYRDALAASRLLANVRVWRPRVGAAPKVPAKMFVAESALIAALHDLAPAAILRNPHLVGRMTETFAYSQLRALTSWETHRCRLLTYDLPNPKNGDAKHADRYPFGEFDFLLRSRETAGLVAIEAKSRDHPRRSDTERLMAFRDALDRQPNGGEHFVAGLALTCSETPVQQIDDRIWAAPLSILWAQG